MGADARAAAAVQVREGHATNPVGWQPPARDDNSTEHSFPGATDPEDSGMACRADRWIFASLAAIAGKKLRERLMLWNISSASTSPRSAS